MSYAISIIYFSLRTTGYIYLKNLNNRSRGRESEAFFFVYRYFFYNNMFSILAFCVLAQGFVQSN